MKQKLSPFLLARTLTMFFIDRTFFSDACGVEGGYFVAGVAIRWNVPFESVFDWCDDKSVTVVMQWHQTTLKVSRQILSFHSDSSLLFRHIHIMDPRYMRSEEKRDDENEFSSLSFVGRLFSCVLVAENVTVLVSTLFSPLQIQYSSKYGPWSTQKTNRKHEIPSDHGTLALIKIHRRVSESLI